MDKLISNIRFSKKAAIKIDDPKVSPDHSVFFRILRVLGLFLVTSVVLLLLGGIYLKLEARSSFAEKIQKPCDNIVVLTGGRDRIGHVFRIIRDSENITPKNVFISGVHLKTNFNDILAANMDIKDNQWLGKIQRCNFILGKDARNTLENAEEVGEWVGRNNINKVVLVTSDYHMRRSMMILKHKNPNLEIIPCAIKSKCKGYLAYFEESLKIIYTWIKLHVAILRNLEKQWHQRR